MGRTLRLPRMRAKTKGGTMHGDDARRFTRDVGRARVGTSHGAL